MLAVDTNVVVRYVTGDEPRQAAKARALVDGGMVFVPASVVLEAEWVLRAVYGFDGKDVARALRTLAGQPTVSFEQPLIIRTALDWSESGMDFADALHLAAAHQCEAFVSFDRELAKQAKRLGATPVRAP